MKWYEDPDYHKMCEKAVKIQELRGVDLRGEDLWQKGDCYIHPSQCIGFYCEGCTLEYGWPDGCIWLPTQAQLQDMVKRQETQKTLDGGYVDLIVGMCFFCFDYGEIRDPSRKYVRQFTSMEQLWLAYAMFKLYNKTWNGEDWI